MLVYVVTGRLSRPTTGTAAGSESSWASNCSHSAPCLLLITDDGAPITITYRGKATKQPSEGGVVFTTPVFETGDARYLWLKGIQAVARGVRDGQILTYEMYQLS